MSNLAEFVYTYQETAIMQSSIISENCWNPMQPFITEWHLVKQGIPFYRATMMLKQYF
jgi:hypothetical protein